PSGFFWESGDGGRCDSPPQTPIAPALQFRVAGRARADNRQSVGEESRASVPECRRVESGPAANRQGHGADEAIHLFSGKTARPPSRALGLGSATTPVSLPVTPGTAQGRGLVCSPASEARRSALRGGCRNNFAGVRNAPRRLRCLVLLPQKLSADSPDRDRKK